MNDISMIVEAVRTLFTPERRTARHMLVLLEATRQARMRTLQAIESTFTVPNEALQGVLRDLTGLGKRLDEYAEALQAVKPSDFMPAELRPLLHKVLWPRSVPDQIKHFTPDFALIFEIENKLAEMASSYKSQSKQFFRDLQEGLGKVDEVFRDIGRGAGKIIRGTTAGVAEGVFGDALPWVIGGVGVVAVGGVLVYAATRD